MYSCMQYLKVVFFHWWCLWCVSVHLQRTSRLEHFITHCDHEIFMFTITPTKSGATYTILCVAYIHHLNKRKIWNFT